MLYGESDYSDKEESGELWSEYGSDGTCGTGLGGFFRGLGIPFGVTLYDDESCDGDEGSLALPY